jgi:hypothetical protein
MQMQMQGDKPQNHIKQSQEEPEAYLYPWSMTVSLSIPDPQAISKSIMRPLGLKHAREAYKS